MMSSMLQKTRKDESLMSKCKERLRIVKLAVSDKQPFRPDWRSAAMLAAAFTELTRRPELCVRLLNTCRSIIAGSHQ